MHITHTFLPILLALSTPITALPTDTSINPLDRRGILDNRFGTGEKGDKCSKHFSSDTHPLCGPCFKCDWSVRKGNTCLPSTKRRNYLKQTFGPQACEAGWTLQGQKGLTDEVVDMVYEIDIVDGNDMAMVERAIAAVEEGTSTVLELETEADAEAEASSPLAERGIFPSSLPNPFGSKQPPKNPSHPKNGGHGHHKRQPAHTVVDALETQHGLWPKLKDMSFGWKRHDGGKHAGHEHGHGHGGR